MKTSLVITSISPPNKAMNEFAQGCRKHEYRFVVIGDAASPANFHLAGCEFYSLAAQEKTGFELAKLCPQRHYARKNIGYLVSMRDGAEVIIDTDDDNYPKQNFWEERTLPQTLPVAENIGHCNVYRYFTKDNIWPRGLPLNAVRHPLPEMSSFPTVTMDCPIQQGLADDNPDVDAIYRLVLPLPVKFEPGKKILLGKNTWCPFNSQNTAWWKEVFPLLYLPAHCSFRMTDIWRSFVAQRICWEYGYGILFHSATVYQERNEHNLMHNFKDEVTGYLHNETICETLAALKLRKGDLFDNLKVCYEALVKQEIIGKKELRLLAAWEKDCLSMIPSS